MLLTTWLKPNIKNYRPSTQSRREHSNRRSHLICVAKKKTAVIRLQWQSFQNCDEKQQQLTDRLVNCWKSYYFEINIIYYSEGIFIVSIVILKTSRSNIKKIAKK